MIPQAPAPRPMCSLSVELASVHLIASMKSFVRLGNCQGKGCLNVISFNGDISACEKGWQWQRVASLLNEMLKGCLNVISFNADISACEKGGLWK
eukprot:7376066-Karenia_brevis.AAC.1